MNTEIASFAEADQFPHGKTQFACGFFGCYMAASMAPLGHAPALTPQQIIDKAEAAYAEYDGNNSISNTDGMSVEQEYELLHQIGLHYQAIALDINTVKAWVLDGYPVLIALAETSVVDMALGGSPYPWHAAGNHIILVTGVTSDGNVLVRDSANCTNLYDPNSLRPGPRRYNAARIQLVSATVVVPPWKPRPTSATPPTGGDTMPVPTGWTKTTVNGQDRLVCPNGHYAIAGIASAIENNTNYNPANLLNEEEYHVDQVQLHNQSLGSGSRQTTRDGAYWWTQGKGVIYEPFLGLELKACYDLIASQQAEIATLKAAQPTSAPMPNVSDALSHVEAALAAAGVVATELGKAVPDLKQ